MTDSRFSKQDIENKGADRTFEGFPMREVVGYDPYTSSLRRIIVDSEGRVVGVNKETLPTDSSKLNSQTILSYNASDQLIYIDKVTGTTTDRKTVSGTGTAEITDYTVSYTKTFSSWVQQ